MHKIIINSLLLATVATQAMAKDVFTGPYIGLEAGYALEKDSTHLTSALLGIDDTQKDNTGAFNGGVFAGYGKRFNSTYLGTELRLDWNNLDRTKVDGTDTSVQKHSLDVAADVRAGFFPTSSTLIYGILGVAYGKFEYSDIDPTIPIAAQSDKWLAGIRGGVGAETQLTANTTARLDWTYTQYQSATSDITVAGIGIGDVKVSPTTNVFHAGVAYSF